MELQLLTIELFISFQIHFGDLSLDSKASSKSVSDAIKRFFPLRYIENDDNVKEDNIATANTNLNEKNANDGTQLNCANSLIMSSLKDKWASLKGKSSHDCVRIFLTCTRKWQFFGNKLFEVQVNKLVSMENLQIYIS